MIDHEHRERIISSLRSIASGRAVFMRQLHEFASESEYIKARDAADWVANQDMVLEGYRWALKDVLGETLVDQLIQESGGLPW